MTVAAAQFVTAVEPVPGNGLMQAAFEACTQALAVCDDGRVMFANRSFVRHFGLVTGAQMVGRRLSELVQSAAAGQLRSTDLPVAGQKLTVISVENFAAGPRIESPLEAMGRMVSAVAHDFNNLLTGILLYCDLLRPGLADNPRMLRYVDEMHHAGEQAAGLIRQLLAAARPQTVVPVVLSWNDAIEGLYDLLQRLIGEDIELALDLAPGLGMVSIGPAQMPQVILNLALNARDAMPNGGRITLGTANHRAPQAIDAAAEQEYVDFSVADCGSGIDELTRSRLLEPFFTTKPAGQGNGLGLATVRRITEEKNGMLLIESRPGHGTTMTVRLPRVPAKDSIDTSLHTPRGNSK
jgi:signal transduction histidine kinase